MNVSALIEKPSAFVPVMMSLAALATVFVHIALVGTAPEPDEGLVTVAPSRLAPAIR